LTSRADVIIPVKRLAESKTRLSPSLSLKNRQKLVLVMMEDVIASLRQSRSVDHMVVLTPDSQVADCAKNLGAQAMMDKTDGGINQSLAEATDCEIKERSGLPLLVLPVDVPLVKPSTIDSIIGRVGEQNHALVVVSPSIEKGTNALLRNPPNAIPTRYGVNSFDAHVAEAMARKVHLEVYRSEDLEIDVDNPSDLYEIMRRGDSTRTSEFLRKILQDQTQ
jgi:2-phospho-L-lactate guanylyltransferase